MPFPFLDFLLYNCFQKDYDPKDYECMQIFEVKNNLVKAAYDTAQENVVLSGFAVVKDASQSFIGQIIHLESNPQGNFAIIKLLFTFDSQGIISSYNGSVPDGKSLIEPVDSQELLELLPIQNPISVGELAQQKIRLHLDRSFLENKLLVSCENQEDNEWLTKNIAIQLVSEGKKVLVIDLKGDLDFSENKIVASEDFKLPLNYETINFIYRGLDDAAAETKALIQEVFLEVQNYVKSLPEQFIPFETFKGVVDEQYDEMDIVELLLLKNKLLKYYEEGIFAQEKGEFDSLSDSFDLQEATIFDLSRVDDGIQREMISYAYTLASKFDKEFYVFVNLDNSNSDKKLLKQIFMAKNVYSSIICSYSFKYLNELKQLSKNSIFFAPIQQQSDFASYNTFLSKLNPHEFIVYGKATQSMPLIVKLEKDPLQEESQPLQQVSEEVEISQEELLDEEIKKDVDEIFTAPRKDRVEVEYPQQEIVEDEFSEEDLDFIDDLGVAELNPDELVQEQFSPEVELQTESEYVQEIAEEAINDFSTGMDIQDNIEDVVNEIVQDFEDTTENVENVDYQTEEDSIQYQNQEQEEPKESFLDVLNQQAQEEIEPPAVDILPASMSSTPIVPVYSADIEPQVQSDDVEQGDTVVHPKYGKGTVEKLISYGSKTLCSINFDNVGRRLLDPNLAELKKV